MASYRIQTRTIANGEKRYKATITVKSNGRIVHRFAKTHKQFKEAEEQFDYSQSTTYNYTNQL